MIKSRLQDPTFAGALDSFGRVGGPKLNFRGYQLDLWGVGVQALDGLGGS